VCCAAAMLCAAIAFYAPHFVLAVGAMAVLAAMRHPTTIDRMQALATVCTALLPHTAPPRTRAALPLHAGAGLGTVVRWRRAGDD